MLYCLLKEDRVLVFKKTEVFYNGKNQHVEELIELAKSEGIELTKEEAEAYMAEMEDVELDSDALKQVAGGLCYSVGLGADQRCNRGGGIAGA